MNQLTHQTRLFFEQMNRGQVDQALVLANEFSQKDPDNPLGYTMLGDALMKKGQHELATTCYQYSLVKKPNQPHVHIALGEAYLLIGESGKAYEYFYKAIKEAPDNADVLQKTGNFLVIVGRLNDAREVLQRAMTLGARHAMRSLLDLKIHMGDRGDIRRFIESNRHLFEGKREDLTFIRAQFSLGEYEEVIRLLKAQDPSDYTQQKKATYYNLLGLTYEKLGRYDQAFEYFDLQNKSKGLSYSGSLMEQTVREIMDNSRQMDTSNVCYRDITEQEFSPLYIIGLPRSGSSLLEQILNTSEHVVAGGELLFVEAAYKKYFEKGMPLERISEWYKEKVEFITKNQEIPKEAPRWLTDKLPSNFVNVGFIKKMIPDAKFLYCRRNPMDNGLSIFRQNFLNPLSYATSQQDIAHFIALERRIMGEWLAEYPDDILTVQYEELVDDFDGVTRQVFDFVDLSWRPTVREFYKNDHYCNTASFDQVRKPLNNNSVHAYKRFEKEMEPMARALEGYGVKD